MKDIIIPIAATIIFIIIVGIFTTKGAGKFIKPIYQTSSKDKVIKIADNEIKVEIAKTDIERQNGLSGKESLEKDSGMLFVFPQMNTTTSFWIKDMLLSIDIIWIDNGKVIDIEEGITPPQKGIDDTKLKLYNPKVPFDYVLEVNAGFVKENNIKPGDNVDLSSI